MTMPVGTNYEAATYYSYEFDPEADFKQFLEEAKANKSAISSSDTAIQVPNEDAKSDSAGETPKKHKNSWTNSLFSWLRKTEKKNKMTVEPLLDPTVNKFRRGLASGPLRSNATGLKGRSRKPISGPLTSLLNASKKDEDVNVEVPYSCLKQTNKPHTNTHSYGPVYLVP